MVHDMIWGHIHYTGISCWQEADAILNNLGGMADFGGPVGGMALSRSMA
jgi:hypothetical protein